MFPNIFQNIVIGNNPKNADFSPGQINFFAIRALASRENAIRLSIETILVILLLLTAAVSWFVTFIWAIWKSVAILG